MKNPLNKRIKRELKSNAGRYIAIFVMMLVIISVMSAYFVVAFGMKESFEENREECNVEDGLFSSYSEISEDILTEAENKGVSIYENYYIDEDILTDTTLRVYKNRTDVDLATVIEGEMPESDNEIAIDRLFAENNNLNIGDTITISGVEMKVTAFVSVPDYSSLFENNTDIIMDATHFGVAIVSDEAFENFEDDGLIYNYSYVYNDDNLSEAEETDLSNDVKEYLSNSGVALSNFIIAENNQAISFVEEDMGSDIPMMMVFFIIILIIMAFVFIVIITNTIEQESQIIGTLLSSGYSKVELAKHYMHLPMLVTIISAFVGNILGYTVLPSTFSSMYYESYSLPPFQVSLNLKVLIMTTILPIAIIIIIDFAVLYKKLSIKPLRFLRKDLGKRSKKHGIKLPNIAFINRFRLRVIIDNKNSYLVLFFGMFFASFILFFGLSMQPTITNYIDSIKNTYISDYQYILKAPVEVDNDDAESFTTYSMETYNDLTDKDVDVTFYGVQEDSKFITDVSINNEEEGIYISDGLAKKLNISVGDTVTFTNSYTNDTYELKVIGTYNYSAGFAVFMSEEQLNKLLDYDTDYFNGYFSNTELTIDENYLASTITLNDMTKVMDQLLSSFGQVSTVCLAVAIIIYMILMYLLTKVIIERNSLNISMMKLFGYNQSEVKKLYLQTTTIVIIVSLIVSLPVVSYLTKVTYSLCFMKMNGYVEAYAPTRIYFIIVAVGIASYLVINFRHVRNIKKVPLSIVLSSRE